MLLLELILDNGSVQYALKTVQKLEFAHNSIIVVKSLSHNRSEPSLELFYFTSENKEIFIKLFLINVHSVIRKSSKVFYCFFKLF